MEGIRPPGSINFDGNNVADAWEKFYEQFEWYLCAIGLDEASDMRKISLFLNVAGAEAQRIFGTFTFVGETEDPKKYADVINKFTNFCMPKKNLVYERYVFNICVQKEGQNVDSYVTELRHKAQTCDYGELKDSLIRDRIVVGINSTQLKEKMLQDKDLSLESAISRCKSAEMTLRQMQVIQEKGSACGGKETEPVNVIKHGRKGNRKSQINNAHPETFDCNKCGKNHQHKKCPAYSAVCHKCKKKGHYKQFCLKPVHVVSLESNKDSVFCGLVKTEKSVKISAINDKKWTHPLNIDGNIVVVKIDTGAGADLLSYGDFLSLQRKPSLKPTKTRLSDYNDNAIDVKGSCVLRVAMHDRLYPVRFIVVENGPSLLGCDTSERLNLVQRVYNVNVKECVLPETNTILNCLPFKHTIQLKADAVPVIHASRRVAATLREPLKKELSRMEKLGVIHKVDHPTEWVNSMVITEKPNGDLRICLDPKDLNQNILREHYPLPKKEEIFAEMCGAKWFSKLDASQAFWQIKLCDKSKDYTTFNTPFGRWAYDRLPYGVCSAPEVFHKVMEQMMENINGVRVYMDDILVWGHTEKEHDERLEAVRDRIRKYGLMMNQEKCVVKKNAITFLGEELSDTLSRASFNNDCIDTELSDIVDAHVDLVFKSFPATDKQLIRFANETLKDPILYAVKNCILHGWKNGQCPAYASFKDELCVINGIIFKGSRIVVPVSMRNEMLCRIHEGHLGQDKQKSMARSVLYWPNMNVHIEEMSNKCAVCQMYKPAQCKESYHTDDDITGPWDKVATDCFHFRGHDYLLLVDYYSNYPEIAKLASLSSSNVILHMKSIFARHGIPRVLVSDNATCYSSRSFKMFADEFNFEHRTSSTGYPQSNGKAEKSVGMVKGVLNKALDSNDDIYLALLAYRTAPMACGKSPSEMLMNRKLRNRLPQVDSESIEINERQVKRKQKQVELYNQHAKDLPVLKPNDVVRVRKDDRWANKAQVLVQLSPRSYKVLTKEGKIIRRNRRQLLRTDEPMNSSDLRDTCNIDVEHSMSNSSVNTEHISEEASKSDNEGTSDIVSETPNDVVVRTSRGGLQSSGHTQDAITEQPPEVQTRRSSRVTGKPLRYGNNSYD